jgi:hypothetical protein
VVRTIAGPGARGLNRVTWDMHMESALALPAAPANARGANAAAGAARGGRGGGRGGSAGENGPLVLPGRYSVSVAVPGIPAPLRGSVVVEADPMDPPFSAEQRAARQDMLLAIYDLQRSLASARRTVGSLADHRAEISQVLERGGGASEATALSERMGRSQSEINRIVGITGTLMRAVESFSAPPTTDQRQQLEWARQDAANAVTTINRVSQTDLPAAYARYARGETPPTIAPLTPLVSAGRKP